MPNYQKHLFIGSLFYGILTYTNTKWQWMPHETSWYIQTLIACLVGALFPDIDTKSKIQKYLYFTVLISIFYLIALGLLEQACLLACISLLPLITNHRGLFHRLWFIILCVCLGNLFCLLNHPILFKKCILTSLFFLVGVISHLWADLGIRRLFR